MVDGEFSQAAQDAAALEDVLEDLERRSRSFGTALTGALASATRGGKGLGDVLKTAGLRLSQIALSAGLKPLDTVLGQAISGFSAGIGKVAGASAPGAPTGRVVPFADGGVISTPRYFPMSGTTGLMGEAGAEAILPLKRGADGALGVTAQPGGATTVVFNVTATDAASFAKSQGQIAAMLTRVVGRGRRGV